ncbi:hypothetical protein AGMMS4952_17420 [Spirochaetia bacterium]|nr:hypothetical protein AGMMS4952_17380 [Spirochaetia bacterium]GHV30420.1 hypothetical protein AGMMS4952_17420 [Spirochaetia bacterium]
MDLLNYTHDAILSFIHHVVINHDDDPLKIFLVCYSKNRYDELSKFVGSLKNITIKFVYLTNDKIVLNKQRISWFFAFFSSKYIISNNVMERHPFKLKKQTEICINYYTAFKSDLVHKPKVNNIDYVIMPSKISSQIDSVASHIPFSRYRYLGLPKEDHIINPRYTRKEIFDKLKMPADIKKMVLYAPTHRDYERSGGQKRNILGYDGDYHSLNEILKKYKAIFIIKIHGGQEKKHLVYINNLSNIIIYKPSYEYTGEDILPYVDLLVTDYSSIAFDFMLTGKPIIYNFFDKEKYEETRGFSWSPVELICAGPISKTKQELENAIEMQLQNNDCHNHYKQKYDWVNDLVHAYNDGNNCERIYLFINKLMLCG